MSTKPKSKATKTKQTKPTTQSKSKVNGGTLRRMKKKAKGVFSVCKSEPKVGARLLADEYEGLGSGPSTYEQVANRSRRQFLEKYGNSTAKMMADLGKLSDNESQEQSKEKRKKPRQKVEDPSPLDGDSDDDNDWLLKAFRPASSPVEDEGGKKPEVKVDKELEELKLLQGTTESFDRLDIDEPAENDEDEDLVVIKEYAGTAEHDKEETFSVHVSIFSDRLDEDLNENEDLNGKRAKSRKHKANSGGRPSNGTDAAQRTVNEPDVADILKQELLGNVHGSGRNLNLNSYEPPPKNMRVLDLDSEENDNERRSRTSLSSHKTEKTTDSEEYRALMQAFHQGI